MIDALIYAVRDTIWNAGINYDQATCDIMDDGRPPPRAGERFVSIHDGAVRSDRDNQLHEWYEFSVTLTIRIAQTSLDNAGTKILHRNINRVPLGIRQGFWAKVEQLSRLLHMNWSMVCLQNQIPNSANDNLLNWAKDMGVDEIYGFCEPARFQSAENMKLVGAEWFASDEESDNEPIGMKSTIRFGKCRRFQPQTLPNGPFV